MNESQKIKTRKSNMKLYPLYQMFGNNLLFYQGINILFLYQVTNLTNAEIVFLHAAYAFVKIFVQLPIAGFIGRIGKKNSIILRKHSSSYKYIDSDSQ